jgi:Uma2 family endonuclease
VGRGRSKMAPDVFRRYDDRMSTTAVITFEEFERLPDIEGKRELIDGEVVTMPPPDYDHSVIAQQLLLLLFSRLPRPRRAWPDGTGYRVGDGWIQPDVSVSWPGQIRDGKYLLGSPQIAVEILSPGEQHERKLTLYFAGGAQEVWTMEPRHKTMTVYLRQGSEILRRAVDREFHSEALQITFTLAEIFAQPEA